MCQYSTIGTLYLTSSCFIIHNSSPDKANIQNIIQARRRAIIIAVLSLKSAQNRHVWNALKTLFTSKSMLLTSEFRPKKNVSRQTTEKDEVKGKIRGIYRIILYSRSVSFLPYWMHSEESYQNINGT